MVSEIFVDTFLDTHGKFVDVDVGHGNVQQLHSLAYLDLWMPIWQPFWLPIWMPIKEIWMSIGRPICWPVWLGEILQFADDHFL